jgi:hypothetical protein
MPQNSKKMAIWIPPETHDALKKEAQAKGLTVSSLSRMILMEYTGVVVYTDIQGRRVVQRQAWVEDGKGGYIPNPEIETKKKG